MAADRPDADPPQTAGETLPPRQPAETATLPPRDADDPFTTLPPPPGPPATLAPDGVTAPSGLAPVPGYDILGELGRGGMGVVYKAKQAGLNRLVALKMVLSGGHAGREELARFRLEAEAIARLQHPNIVAVHEVGEHDGRPFFSLEFCPGGSLDKRLQGTPMPAGESATLVETLARAMHAAHEAGVVHRDLKPANVLLAADGTPKITDFGLAKKLDGDSGQTKSGAVMGTPSYMAPEQAGGKKDVGPSADVYALGAILYECLTGRPPFRAATPLDTMLQVVAEEPVPPGRLNRQVPRDLETVCLKCLQKEPHRRYPTGEALADDLRRFRAGEPVAARPAGRVERIWKWTRRRPAAAALLAVSGTAAITLVTGLLVSNRLIADREEKATRALLDRTAALNDLREEQNKTAAAFQREADERRKAERLLTENYLDRGLAACQQGDLPTGFLWLGRSLEQAPRDAVELQRFIRSTFSAWRPRLTSLRSAFDCQAHEPWLGSPYDRMTLTPDGTKAVTWAGKDIRLWDVASGKPIGVPLKHSDQRAPAGDVRFLAFSADGRVLLAGNTYGLSRWDTATGERIGQPIRLLEGQADLGGHQRACAGAFSPDGKMILAVTRRELDPFVARRWNAETGKPVGEPVLLGEPTGKWSVLSANGYAISPDGKTVLISHGDVSWIVDSSTGQRIGEPLRHESPFGVHSAAFSPDGKTVVTDDGRNLRLWDSATGESKGIPLGHEGPVSAVTFFPDGSSILTGSGDGFAWIWDATTGKPVGPPLRHQDRVWAVSVSRDGRKILTACSTEARMWKVASLDDSGKSLPARGPIRAVTFSADGKRLLTGSGYTGNPPSGEAQIWDASAGVPIGKPVIHRRPVVAVDLGPDGRTLLTRERPRDLGEKDDAVARLSDALTGNPIGDPIRHSFLDRATFSPDGRTLLTLGGDNRPRLWDARSGKLIGAFLESPDDVRILSIEAAAFRPDGKVVATTGATLKKPTNEVEHFDLRLWDPATGKPIGQPIKLQQQTWHISFSPDGTRFLTISHGKTARVWNTATLEPIGLPLQHAGEVRHAAFSSDGKAILTVSGRLVRLWNAATQVTIGGPLEHSTSVEEGTFSADGRFLATRSADGVARLWDVFTGQPIGPVFSGVTAMAFSPGEGAIAIATDKAVRTWQLPIPMEGDSERIVLWTQVVTGLEIDEHRAVRMLDAKTWQGRRNRLEELGGPPLP